MWRVHDYQLTIHITDHVSFPNTRDAVFLINTSPITILNIRTSYISKQIIVFLYGGGMLLLFTNTNYHSTSSLPLSN